MKNKQVQISEKSDQDDLMRKIDQIIKWDADVTIRLVVKLKTSRRRTPLLDIKLNNIKSILMAINPNMDVRTRE